MPTDHVMSPEEVAGAELARLRDDHRRLDARIAALGVEGLPVCSFTLGRLKREKLRLKDRIARLEDRLTPDIIA
ncbi:DUF465 domain-containing protein [Paracoccus sp. S-4012]|uniref:YdcH family protein n=1 Tax=Paracoccus sp. S-4012 TaxID=2665648 RepID=UPI0012AF9D4C|nr:YdcH family protein [Paracoccus sp. S-4012]MRX50309.1 DUF465 domain-containing protein [Paracoccus sp. S-4012]